MSREDSTLLSLVSSPFIVRQSSLTDLPSRKYQMGTMVAESICLKRNTSFPVLYLTNSALVSCGVGETHGEQDMKEGGSDTVGVTLLSESDLNLCPSLVLGSMVLLRLLCFS